MSKRTRDVDLDSGLAAEKLPTKPAGLESEVAIRERAEGEPLPSTPAGRLQAMAEMAELEKPLTGVALALVELEALEAKCMTGMSVGLAEIRSVLQLLRED